MDVSFRNIISRFAFQEIFDLEGGRIHKHEVLSRFYDKTSHKQHNPELVINELLSKNKINSFTQSQIMYIGDIPFDDFGLRHISLNLESSQLSDVKIVRDIIRLKEKIDVPLTIEVTERDLSALSGKQVVGANLLVNEGILLSLDDFGVGSSGLIRLLQLPVAEIKLDKSIITRLVGCNRSMSMVSGVKRMCEDLGVRIIAEGVEDKHTADVLFDMNISLHQGYFYSKPKVIENLGLKV